MSVCVRVRMDVRVRVTSKYIGNNDMYVHAVWLEWQFKLFM